jgi:neutral ceramidase
MQVGFARADITPAIGREVPGGFSKAFSRNIHDPLLATAVVIGEGQTRVALVGLDNLSVKRSVVQAARRAIEERTGIPGANVMVGASHTHNGGPCVGALPGDFAQAFDPEFCEDLAQNRATAPDPEYLREVADQIATAVTLADARKQEARLAVGRGAEATVAFNRRFKMRDGTQMTHPGKGNPDILEPAGPADPEVGVLSAWLLDGRFLGAVVNFTCHGTVFSGGISADWPYYMRETITGALNPDALVVFLNGACGDVTQVNNLSLQESEFGEKWARRVGQKVGAEALKAIADAEPANLLPIASAQTVFPIKTREVSEERFRECLALVKSDAPHDHEWWFARDVVLLHEQNKWEPEATCEVQAIQIGSAAYVSNAAEYFCQFGLNIKRRSNFPYTWVVELANGCVGYVPTPEAMGPHGGGYEPRLALSSKLAPEAGQMIEDASVELLASLTPGAEPPRPTVPHAGSPWNMGSSKASTV